MSIYVLHGDEPLLIQEELRQLQTEHSSHVAEQLSESSSLAEILDLVSMGSLFAEHRLIIAKNP